MKLDMPKKITIVILAILSLWASVLIVERVISYSKTRQIQSSFYSADMNLLNKEIPSTANKYKLYSEIFNSKEPVLVYGYTPAGLTNVQNEHFNKELTKLVEEKNVQHKIVAVNNLEWESLQDALEEKYVDDSATCSTVTKEQEELENFIEFMDDCFLNSCIIDVKNNSVVKISRNAEYIVKTLLGEVEIYKDSMD